MGWVEMNLSSMNNSFLWNLPIIEFATRNNFDRSYLHRESFYLESWLLTFLRSAAVSPLSIFLYLSPSLFHSLFTHEAIATVHTIIYVCWPLVSAICKSNKNLYWIFFSKIQTNVKWDDDEKWKKKRSKRSLMEKEKKEFVGWMYVVRCPMRI